MLSPVEKSDIRRHLGFPAIAVNRSATGSVGEMRNYGINMNLENLESRLDELDVVDEARLTGACIGTVAIVGQDPVVGNTVTVTVNSTDLGSPVPLLVTAAAGDTRFNLAAKLTALAAQNVALVEAGFAPGGPFNGSVLVSPNINPQFELKAPNPFTLTVAFSGLTGIAVTCQGAHVEPSAPLSKDANNLDVLRYGYIPILNFLSSAIGGVTQNSAVSKAGDYVRGMELKERQKLLAIYKNDLCNFLGISNNGGGGGSFSL